LSFAQSVVNTLYPAWRMHVDMDMVHITLKIQASNVCSYELPTCSGAWACGLSSLSTPLPSEAKERAVDIKVRRETSLTRG